MYICIYGHLLIHKYTGEYDAVGLFFSNNSRFVVVVVVVVVVLLRRMSEK